MGDWNWQRCKHSGRPPEVVELRRVNEATPWVRQWWSPRRSTMAMEWQCCGMGVTERFDHWIQASGFCPGDTSMADCRVLSWFSEHLPQLNLRYWTSWTADTPLLTTLLDQIIHPHKWTRTQYRKQNWNGSIQQKRELWQKLFNLMCLGYIVIRAARSFCLCERWYTGFSQEHPNQDGQPSWLRYSLNTTKTKIEIHKQTKDH